MPLAAARRVLLEIAADDVEGAVGSARAGADRLELCAALGEGGLTPSPGVLAAVKERVRVPVFVMVRPRGGDFAYTPAEIDAMAKDIDLAAAHGADGFVLGVLTPHGAIDGAAMRTLLAAAAPLPVTFHRAFDRAADQAVALQELVALGCARVLTSAGAPTAAAGASRLRALVAQAGERLCVVAGGGVRASTLAAVLATRVREVHAGPRTSLPATAGHARDGHATTDLAEVRALATGLGHASGRDDAHGPPSARLP